MKLGDLVRQIQETILADPKLALYEVVDLNDFICNMEPVVSLKLEVDDESERVYLNMEL